MIISYRRDSDEAAESEVAAVAAAAESSGAPGPGCRGPSGQPGLARTRSSRLRPGPSDAVGPARCSDSARRGGWPGGGGPPPRGTQEPPHCETAPQRLRIKIPLSADLMWRLFDLLSEWYAAAPDTLRLYIAAFSLGFGLGLRPSEYLQPSSPSSPPCHTRDGTRGGLRR